MIPDDGWAPVRRQTIIWITYWRIYALFGVDGLKYFELISGPSETGGDNVPKKPIHIKPREFKQFNTPKHQVMKSD